MSIIEFQMKTHSVEDITCEFNNLNKCVIHGCTPSVLKIVHGRKKHIAYTINCKDDECGKITSDKNEIERIWNKWNQKEGVCNG